MNGNKIKGSVGSLIIHHSNSNNEENRRSHIRVTGPAKVNVSFVILSTFIFCLILSLRSCEGFILSTNPSVTSKIIWHSKYNRSCFCDLPTFFHDDNKRIASSFCLRLEGDNRMNRLTSLYGTFHPEPNENTTPQSYPSNRIPTRSSSQLQATSSENLKAESSENQRRGRGRPQKKVKQNNDTNNNNNKSTHSWSGGVARLARAAAKAAAEATERESHHNGHSPSTDNTNNDTNGNANGNTSVSHLYQPSSQRHFNNNNNSNKNGSERPRNFSPFKSASYRTNNQNGVWNIGPPRKQESVSTSSPESINDGSGNKRGAMGSLRQLTKVIDKQLYASGPRGVWKSNYPRAEGPLVHQARDSMSSLLGYNQVKGDWKSHSAMNAYNVAFVFGKSLINDQITVEYATRIRTLAKLFKNEPEFRPSLVCFCGARSSTNNHVATADAGYLFFRHICNINGIDLNGVNVFIDNISTTDEEAIRRVTAEVMHNYAPEWLKRSNRRILSTETPTASHPPESSRGQHPPFDGNIAKKDKTMESYDRHLMSFGHRANKIQVHFTLVSTEYDLCNLNDIHHRSPNRSFLKAIEKMGDNTNLETSWSFQYATYPFVYAKDEAVMFLGKCYLLGEELVPLILNLRGVVDQTEFFQRDNYLTLASIRRSLVSYVEDLHRPHQSLKAGLKSHSRKIMLSGGESAEGDIIAILESALLSLGRCIDLAKPAGLLLSSVPKSDWKKALDDLKHALNELRLCDPDVELHPIEWNNIIDDDNDESGVTTGEMNWIRPRFLHDEEKRLEHENSLRLQLENEREKNNISPSYDSSDSLFPISDSNGEDENAFDEAYLDDGM